MTRTMMSSHQRRNRGVLRIQNSEHDISTVEFLRSYFAEEQYLNGEKIDTSYRTPVTHITANMLHR